MNELFFSAMFIGSLLFGNPETKEIPSELSANQTEVNQEPKGKIELISNTDKSMTFKITGDQINDKLALYVNDQNVDCTIENNEFTIGRPEDNESHSCNVELKSGNENNTKSYASYLISF